MVHFSTNIYNRFNYLSLITDAYSRKIVGWSLKETLKAEGPMDALIMALLGRRYYKRKLIHHSDRGLQYCCCEYVKLLKSNKIKISMTQNGDPYENALAERMNGILKGEFLLYGFPSYEKAKQVIDRSIRDYNSYRPHSSLDYLTPIQAHQKEGRLPKRWKKKEYQKVDSNINPP